jgi:hypothetical protein
LGFIHETRDAGFAIFPRIGYLCVRRKGAEDILALKRTGVPDKIITAMVNKSASASSPAPFACARASSGSNRVEERKPADKSG